ncbi:bifunctional riboflavin kinase/FAD synthetase [Coxiella endosymbiont of Amblyomma nuttalli]|uniref:bifunctional riboflavin kinase/FAD synthetase n=1 Tax=Coxiella endosymbiont of Amblyomma nuttalli TaxID=2749996 RepID=UPI001BA48049|nr:bifunctional riboflavin kinase/FAD synthetase [Coxiella endosymbiont of Amblyomma nuttalli]QTS84017.1 Riboflavin biosynthesis protein RibF [Coxiella endosymbiont of Amblyomma nuttalli]
MELIRGKHNLVDRLHSCVATLGNFDGLHLGHQALLTKLKQLGQKLNLPTVVIIFEPQPKEFFAKYKAGARLMRFREKWCALAKWKIDYVLCLRFNQALADLHPDDFVQQILIDRLYVKAIVVGDNCRFGAKRVGNYAVLKRLGKRYRFKAIVMSPVLYEGERVSSTRVRIALQAGNISLVQALLGGPYKLSGKVILGEKRGYELGFPTANIDLHRDVLPLSGIFVVRGYLNNKVYPGVASLGIRPTFKGTRPLLEVYLFGFSQNIYDCYLKVEFLHKLRSEARFKTIDALLEQMRQDVLKAKEYFQKIGG